MNVTVIVGITCLCLLCIPGCMMACHFIMQICCKPAPNTQNQEKQFRRRLKMFRFGCVALMTAATIELIILIPQYIMIIDTSTDINHRILQTCFGLIIDLMHAFNFAMIIVLFIIRLKNVLDKSVFDYSSSFYKFLLITTFIFSIFGSISIIINRMNLIYQILNNTIEENKWYFYPISYGLTTTIVLLGMMMYLLFQLLLVYLLSNALVKVCLISLQLS